MNFFQKERLLITFLGLFFILCIPFFIRGLRAHPDSATPYWYPSSYIYGFVKGCADTVENSRSPITTELWPEEIRSVCGCVFDSLRHALTFQEASDNESQAGMQLIVSATMPICINEELMRKKNATD